MRIMIVEDEPLVRIGMKSIIPWEKHGYKILGEASDGKEAVCIATQCKPDIILVDILLPEMNGLDFINNIKSVLDSSRFIILSNWEDLKYYRKAISLGVSEYIVKSSVQPQEILKIVDRVSKEIKKQRVFEESDNHSSYYYRSDMIILNEFLNQILEKEITDEELIREKMDLYNINLTNSSLYLLVITTEYTSDNDLPEEEIKTGSLLGVCNEIVSDVSNGIVFRNYEGMYIVLLSIPSKEHVEEYLEYLTTRLHETIYQLFDFNIAIGVSDILFSIPDISKAYSQGKKALERLFFDGFGNTFYHKKLITDKRIVAPEIKSSFSDIISTTSLFEIPGVIKKIETFSKLLLKQRSLSKQKTKEFFAGILYHFRELSRAAYLEDELDNKLLSPFDVIETAKNFNELVNKTIFYLEQINAFLEARYLDSAQRLVNGVDKYIEDNYSEKITLDELAKSIHFSPSYISRVYKNETGITVHEKIIQVKIEKSKELLLQYKTLASIAELLNFSSESYFIKVFKEYEGKTPGQFVRTMTKNAMK